MIAHNWLADFEKNGFVHLEEIFDDEELQPLLNEIEAVVDRKTEQMFEAGNITEKYEDLPVETRWAKICDMHPQREIGWNQEIFSPAVYRICTNPKLLDICEGYIGPEITLNGDFWVRPNLPNEDKTTIPWHQDSFYYNGSENQNSSFKILSVWIPLVDVDERNGCLQAIPGSHTWGLIPYHSVNHKQQPIENVESRGKAVSVRMKKGDVFLFNQLTLHRSLPNVSEGIRWSIDIRYSPTNQPFTWHELTDSLFDKVYPTLRVRSRSNPASVQSFDDWKAKRQSP